MIFFSLTFPLFLIYFPSFSNLLILYYQIILMYFFCTCHSLLHSIHIHSTPIHISFCFIRHTFSKQSIPTAFSFYLSPDIQSTQNNVLVYTHFLLLLRNIPCNRPITILPTFLFSSQALFILSASFNLTILCCSDHVLSNLRGPFFFRTQNK